jgi:peptide deformylase
VFVRTSWDNEEEDMIKELCKDDKVLGTKCTRATAEDAELVQDLIDTLRSIEDGACLAANQIGVTKALGVYLDDDGEPHVLYNPRLLMGLNATRTAEGCLSHDEPSKVTRYAKVKVSYDELVDGELVPRRRDFTGWTAQMVQHIIDHCNGKLV